MAEQLQTSDEYKTVEITKRVPVADRESLKAWLNQELKTYLATDPDRSFLGSKALDLIEEAGFALKHPVVKR